MTNVEYMVTFVNCCDITKAQGCEEDPEVEDTAEELKLDPDESIDMKINEIFSE
jgi:hypothetical protein